MSAVRRKPPAIFKPPLEKDEQQAVTRLLRLAKFRVGATSQYRRSGQMVGLPDLVVLHCGLGRGGWWETKKYQARGFHPFDRSTWRPEPLSAKQLDFRVLAVESGQLHGWGGRREAEDWLITIGLAVRAGNGSILLTPNGKAPS